MRDKFHWDVRASRRELLLTTVGETLRDIYLDGCEAVGKEMQVSTRHYIKYVLTHLEAVGTMDLILLLYIDKWLRSNSLLMQMTIV